MAGAYDLMGINAASESDAEVYDSSEDEMSRSKQFSTQKVSQSDSEDGGDDNDVIEEPGVKYEKSHVDFASGNSDLKSRKKVISEEDNLKRLKQIKKSGVVYLSTIPPYMKPIKLRQILERFGEVGRIYLSPEDPKAYSLRVKAGGNRKKKFVEGWAEYMNKKKAKIAVEALNGNPIGGKKGSFYHDDIMNMIYLPKFKWHDLTEQISLEAQERQEKLKAEIAQATRENRVFIDNVEKKERMERLKRKSEELNEKGEANETKFQKPKSKRPFDQKPVKKNNKKRATGNSADLQSVLSKVF